MLCLSGFELYSRWVFLSTPQDRLGVRNVDLHIRQSDKLNFEFSNFLIL